ncbi:hypothetical protein LTR56_027488 [Elasticomyces elasticus]|nr:hypothetical protein LTR56_027488 [Elasticomyces elasticus]KAK4890788.1 hypothetical protein LTR49_028713 [Elasticomyces elasticus]KAK5733414.1 hypothetical protein LTS12_026943 [Elasticomyces elasticus]
MPPFNGVVASLDFTHAANFTDGIHEFIAHRSIILSYVEDYWASIVAWLSQPSVFVVILAWAITFTIIIGLVLSLEFGPIGVVASSIAAAFQAWMYGAFTPAAGIFATLTSLGMLGLLMPVAVVLAACAATVVALIVWASRAGV